MIIKFIYNLQDFFDKIRSEAMVKRLLAIPKENWLEIEHDFNRWKFNQKFYDLMPKWWVKKWNKRIGQRAYNIIDPICKIVRENFTEKDILYYHNVHKGKMSHDEFEYWFSLHLFGNMEIFYKKKQILDKIDWNDDYSFEVIYNSAQIIKKL